MEMDKKYEIELRPFMTIYFLFFSICLVGAITHLYVYEIINLQYFWYLIYMVSFVLILGKFRRGLLFEPLFLLSSSYLFLIAIGTLFFQMIKGKTYDLNLLNLVGIGYLSLILGILLSQNYFFRIRSTQIVCHIYHKMRSRFAIRILFVIGLAAAILLFVKGGIPLLAKDVNEAKLRLISGSGYLNFFFIGLTIVSLSMLYDACATNEKRKLFYSHIIAVLVFILLLFTGYRGRTLVFVGKYVLLLLFLKGRVFSIKWFFLTSFIFILFLGGVGAYRRGPVDISSITKEIGIVLAARPVIFQMIVNKFDETNYFHGTRYLYDFKKMLPGAQTGANVDLKYEIFPNAEKMPELAGITPSIIGEAYMNFGPTGIFWVMLILGLLSGFIYKHMKQKPSYTLCLFYFTFIFIIMSAIQAGIGTLLVPLIYQSLWIFLIGVFYEKRIVLI